MRREAVDAPVISSRHLASFICSWPEIRARQCGSHQCRRRNVWRLACTVVRLARLPAVGKLQIHLESSKRCVICSLTVFFYALSFGDSCCLPFALSHLLVTVLTDEALMPSQRQHRGPVDESKGNETLFLEIPLTSAESAQCRAFRW